MLYDICVFATHCLSQTVAINEIITELTTNNTKRYEYTKKFLFDFIFQSILKAMNRLYYYKVFVVPIRLHSLYFMLYDQNLMISRSSPG
ncbi:Hypothetical predicted protein [Octopus vulgaris]|uniref:Uncharacterized protein n=1 Tax=Octopus vulgaris TaxID=6645 RepID=A0AA36AK98_OCTVU|nr:Hypothetical predicted protein [Octopus vulgaris]